MLSAASAPCLDPARQALLRPNRTDTNASSSRCELVLGHGFLVVGAWVTSCRPVPSLMLARMFCAHLCVHKHTLARSLSCAHMEDNGKWHDKRLSPSRDAHKQARGEKRILWRPVGGGTEIDCMRDIMPFHLKLAFSLQGRNVRKWRGRDGSASSTCKPPSGCDRGALTVVQGYESISCSLIWKIISWFPPTSRTGRDISRLRASSNNIYVISPQLVNAVFLWMALDWWTLEHRGLKGTGRLYRASAQLKNRGKGVTAHPIIMSSIWA